MFDRPAVPKFKIGDVVAIKAIAPNYQRFLIHEIHQVTCSAGTQIMYKGFTIVNENGRLKRLDKEKLFDSCWQLMRDGQLNEVLLEEVKDE